MPNGEMLFAPEHSLSDIGELLSSLRNAGLDESEALSMASLSLAEEVGGKLLALLKKGAPDEAATAAIGVLVGLISVGHGRCSENATAAIRVLASRGTHGDSIREAGGIPMLLRVLRDAESTAGVEHASGALAHLVMQRSANREAVCGHGGVPLLVAQLHRSSTAADYAAASLGTMAICGPPAAVEAIREGLVSLPTAFLDRHRHLSRVLASSDHVRPTHPPDLLPPPTVPSCHTSAAAHEGHATMAVRECARSFGCALLGTLVPLVNVLQRLVWTQVVWEWSGGRNAYAGMDNASNCPEDFMCPITHELMAEPAVASDGHTYERRAIREVIDRGNGRSPLTREVLSHDVYLNFQLRRCIQRWHDERAAPIAPKRPSGATVGMVVASVALPPLVWLLATAVGRGGLVCGQHGP